MAFNKKSRRTRLDSAITPNSFLKTIELLEYEDGDVQICLQCRPTQKGAFQEYLSILGFSTERNSPNEFIARTPRELQWALRFIADNNDIPEKQHLLFTQKIETRKRPFPEQEMKRPPATPASSSPSTPPSQSLAPLPKGLLPFIRQTTEFTCSTPWSSVPPEPLNPWSDQYNPFPTMKQMKFTASCSNSLIQNVRISGLSDNSVSLAIICHSRAEKAFHEYFSCLNLGPYAPQGTIFLTRDPKVLDWAFNLLKTQRFPDQEFQLLEQLIKARRWR